MRLAAWRNRLRQWHTGVDPFVLLVFAVALSLRIIFLATVRQIPIYGDMLTFASTALGTGHFFLYGNVYPTVAQLFFRRGPFLPAVYALAFVAYFRDPAALQSFDTVITRFNWDVIRYPQAVLDAGTCALVASLGLRLFDRRAGILGGLLAAVYPPLILWVGAPLREVWVGFGLVGALWFSYHAIERADRRWYFLTGAALGLVGQMLPTLIGLGLIIPGLAATLIGARPRQLGGRKAWQHVLAFMIGCLVIWIPRWLLQAVMLGSVDVFTIGTGGTGGFWRFAASQGWVPDGTVVEEVSLGVFKGAGTAGEILLGAIAAFRAAPLTWLGGLAANLYRVWLYPYNDFQQTFILTWNGQVWLHWVIMGLALLGLPLAVWAQRRSVYLILIPLYVSAFFGIDTVQSRYAAPVMPLTCLGAGFGAVALGKAIARFRPGPLGVVGLLGAGTLAGILRLPSLLLLWPLLAPVAAQAIHVALVTAVGVCLAAILFRGLRQQYRAIAAIASLALPGMVIFFGFVYLAFGSPAWHAWSATLTGPLTGIHLPPERIEQVIGLPEGGIGGGTVVLLIDMVTNDSAGLVVSVNDIVVKPAGQRIPIRPEKFGDSFYSLWAQFQGRDMSDYRQWWEIPLPGRLLAGADSAAITVRVDDHYPFAWARVYGDYPTPLSQAGIFDGPRITLGPQDNANHRFHWDFSDTRLDGRIPLASRLTTSRRYAQGSWRSDDLSGTPGRQTGTYRVRLAVVQRNALADGNVEVQDVQQIAVY